MKHKPTLLLIGTAYLGFVGLGLPTSILGVAWPSIRGSFGLSLDAIGVLLIAATAGSLVASFSAGPMLSRVGTGRFVLFSSLLAFAGLLAYALAPAWWVMVLFSTLVGAAGGALDAALNVYFAENHGSRLMNWLHACFGLGSTLGPAVTTVILNLGLSWRWSYALAAVFYAIVVLGFAVTQKRWPNPQATAVETQAGSVAPSTIGPATWRLPVVWLGVLVFFLLAGTEIAAGQWPYSLFTEVRSVAPNVAGLWMTVYWASLTVGRIAFGIAGDRLEVVSSLRVSMLAIICGAVLLWWNPSNTLSFLGLALMGFAFAPLFPLLQLVTPERVGTRHTANAIGFQAAAAGLGMGILPGFAGTLAERFGLEIIGPFILVGAVVMFAVHELIAARATRRVVRARGARVSNTPG